jgi:protein-S-isoprenylcysteine O-methyltransferase Ste14
MTQGVKATLGFLTGGFVPTRSESVVWSRGIIGVVLCLVGIVWIAQGTNVMHGSGMSGHGVYAVLGVVVLVIGVALLVWAVRIRNRRTV